MQQLRYDKGSHNIPILSNETRLFLRPSLEGTNEGSECSQNANKSRIKEFRIHKVKSNLENRKLACPKRRLNYGDIDDTSNDIEDGIIDFFFDFIDFFESFLSGD